MTLNASHDPLVIERKESRGHDWGMLLTAALLLAVGIFSLASIDNARGTVFASRQMIFAALGMVVFFVFNRIKLATFRAMAPALYGANILVLVATLLVGKSRGVTSRWIDIGPFQFQPSEISKLLLALTLATYFANREDKMDELGTYLGALLHAAPILALILLQPHLGATVALLFLLLSVAIAAGVPWKYFPATLAILVAVGGIAWFTPKVMPPYMRARVEAQIDKFVGGDHDPRGKDYQQWQSKMAIGSGGAMGEGFFRGEQKAAGVIPVQEADFIFSVIGEEGGFFGSCLVLSLYGAFFFFVWRRGFMAQTLMGRSVAVGLMAVLGFHTVANLAMVIGFGPVVGLWLPFMSHGGTSLWMCMGALGLLDQCE